MEHSLNKEKEVGYFEQPLKEIDLKTDVQKADDIVCVCDPTTPHPLTLPYTSDSAYDCRSPQTCPHEASSLS